MPRALRAAVGGLVYHVLNRANARLRLFDRHEEYELFEQVLTEAHEKVATRTLAFCVMPNHWHMVLWPREDRDLSEFMRWLTVAHTQRRHAIGRTAGTGHIYQGGFKSFPVQCRRPTAAQRASGMIEMADPLYRVLRCVERNALGAGLVKRAEHWRWTRLWRRTSGDAQQRVLLTDPPEGWAADWLAMVNQPETEEELAAVRRCVNRGRPLRSETWVRRIAATLGLESTLRARGRPRKTANKGS